MARLTVAEYDLAEQNAILEAPLEVFGAFQPEFFRQFGYTTRVQQESELHKFVDANHDNQYGKNIAGILDGLTKEEFELVKLLTEKVLNFTESSFGIKSLARGNISRSLVPLRHIKYLVGESRPAIFEIGPGAGYLGAMLMLEGFPYAATDITQSLYLYQNHLWNAVSDGNVIELANDNSPVEGFPTPAPGQAIHVPWWKFSRLKPGLTPNFEVVTSNDCLNEMGGHALQFTLNITRGFGSESNSPIFVIHGWGSTRMTGTGASSLRFHRSGFVPVHHDSMITIMAPRGSFAYLRLPSKVSRLRRRILRVLRNVTATPPPPPSLHLYENFNVRDYSSRSNPWSKAILEARKLEIRQVSLEDVDQFHRDLFGGEVPVTPNEEFMNLAGSFI